MFEAAEESGTKVKATFHGVRLRESCWSDFFHVSSIQRDLGWKASHDSLNDSATALVKTSVSVSVIRIISAVKEWLKKYLHVKVGWGQEHTQAFRSNKSSRGLLNILYICNYWISGRWASSTGAEQRLHGTGWLSPSFDEKPLAHFHTNVPTCLGSVWLITAWISIRMTAGLLRPRNARIEVTKLQSVRENRSQSSGCTTGPTFNVL